MTNSKHKAAIPNPALDSLKILIGQWETTVGTHPLVPNTTLQGHSTFKLIEGGAFLIWYSEIEHKDFPTGIAIFGSDDATGEYFMMYFDERKVSRKYEVSFQDSVLKWWRMHLGFRNATPGQSLTMAIRLLVRESYPKTARPGKEI